VETGRLVRIHRRLRRVPTLDGFVVGIGIRWVILHRCTDDLDLDGYTAVRRKHVRRAELLDESSLPAQALRRMGRRPTPALDVEPTTTGTLLRTLADAFDVLTVHPEERDPKIFWIGQVTGFGTKSVSLWPVDAAARWEPVPISLPFGVITRVDFGGRYETALAAVAGPSPERLAR